MGWTVNFKKKAAKATQKLPLTVQDTLQLLVSELEVEGPIQPEWSHFGKLRGQGDCYHCHIKSGRPTFVVCWQVTDKVVKILEVYYVGPHESAPY